MTKIFYLLVVVLAVAGFFIAYYIGHKKRRGEKMVCLLKAKCEVVVHSEYSRFFAVPLEYWGMFYYGLTALNYSFLFFYPQFATQNSTYAFGVAAVFAFLFSIYLTLIQAVKLKEWCSWCLVSALCSSAIFLLVLGIWSAY